MRDLHHLLLQRFEEKQLAHFYLLLPPYGVADKRMFLQSFVHQFIFAVLGPFLSSDYRKSPLTFPQFQHMLQEGAIPDILEIAPEPAESGKKLRSYVLENFSEFFSFLQMGRFQLPHRFIIIHEAHLLQTTLANKLLKSLEEPPAQLTIFLMHPEKTELLPTLFSRAVKLRLPLTTHPEERNSPHFYSTGQQQQWLNHYWPTNPLENPLENQGLKETKKTKASKKNQDASQQKALNEQNEQKEFALLLQEFLNPPHAMAPLLQFFRDHPQQEEELIRLILDWEIHHDSHFRKKDLLLQTLRWMEQSKKFHNQNGERIFPLLHYFQTP